MPESSKKLSETKIWKNPGTLHYWTYVWQCERCGEIQSGSTSTKKQAIEVSKEEKLAHLMQWCPLRDPSDW